MALASEPDRFGVAALVRAQRRERELVPNDFGGTWTRDLAMVNITRAGENLVLTSAIMGGPKACYARGGPGAKMGSLKLKVPVGPSVSVCTT